MDQTSAVVGLRKRARIAVDVVVLGFGPQQAEIESKVGRAVLTEHFTFTGARSGDAMPGALAVIDIAPASKVWRNPWACKMPLKSDADADDAITDGIAQDGGRRGHGNKDEARCRRPVADRSRRARTIVQRIVTRVTRSAMGDVAAVAGGEPAAPLAPEEEGRDWG